MDEKKKNSSDLAEAPDFDLDDLEFQDSADLGDLELQSEGEDLDSAFGDLDFSAESEGDPFSDVSGDAVATADYDLPQDTTMEETFDSESDDSEWESSASLEGEEFDSTSGLDDVSGAAESDASMDMDDDIPLPPLMEEDEGPVALSEDELDRILATDTDEEMTEFQPDASDATDDFQLSDDASESMQSGMEDSMGFSDSSDFGDSDSLEGVDQSDLDDLGSSSLGDDFSEENSDFDSHLSTNESDDFGSLDSMDSESDFGEISIEDSDSDEGLPMDLEDEGPVALSEDELGNILEDVEDGDPQFAEGLLPEEEGRARSEMETMPEDDLGAIEEDDFDVAIGGSSDSDDELMMKSGDEFSSAVEDTDFPVFEDELESSDESQGDPFALSGDDSEPIELKDDDLDISDDELSQAVLEGEDFSEEEFAAPPLSVLDSEEDESITLTPEELGNIVYDREESEDDLAESAEAMAFDEPDSDAMGASDFGSADSDFDAVDHSGFDSEGESDFGALDDSDEIAAPPSILDDDEDETIALSASELDNILEDVSEEAIDEVGIDSGAPDEQAVLHEQERERNAIVIDEPEEDIVRDQRQESMAEAISASEGVNKDELKKMISYLDRLFDQLPEDTVREFSRSEYFDLYKKVMQDLGIQ